MPQLGYENNMFEDDVFAALRGSTPANPVRIPSILNVVDARQRMLLAQDELNAALGALIEAGKAREVAPGVYAAGRGSQAFTPVDAATFEAAVEEYRRAFDVAASGDHDDSGTLVKLCFDTSTTKPSDAALDDFTEALEQKIGDVADVLGFEIGNDVLELHILVDEGESADSVAAACALAAGEWGEVSGHRIVIVEVDGSEREYR